MNNILVVLFLSWFALPWQANAIDHFIFKAAAGVTVIRVNFAPPPFDLDDKVVTKTLTGNDLINLTLGAPLGTKVDSKTAILALAVAIEGPGAVAAPTTRLIIFNPDPNVTGAAKVVALVATLTNLDFDLATLTKGSKGQGIGEVNFPETTTGVDPANNKFFAAKLNGSGQATASLPAVAGNIDKFGFTLKSLSGDLHIKFKLASKPADPAFDLVGTVLKGMFKTSGKPLAKLDL